MGVPHEIAIAITIAVVLNIFVERIHRKRQFDEEDDFKESQRRDRAAYDKQMEEKRALYATQREVGCRAP